MTARRILLWLALIIAAALTLGSAAAQTEARARFVHADFNSPPIDIYVNGELAVADLAHGESSPYLWLPGSAFNLRATVAGAATPLRSQSVRFDGHAAAIVFSANAAAPLMLVADELQPLEMGWARLTIVNALADATAFSVDSDNEALAVAVVPPGGAHGPFELPAESLEFSIAPATDEGATHDFGATAAAGASHVLVIHGSADDPRLLEAKAAADAGERSGRVRFIHAAQGVAPVDLKINNRMIIPSLAFATPSEHIALPSGSQALTLSLSGAAFTSMTFDAPAGAMQTVAVMGSPAALKIAAFADSTRDLNQSSATVNLINAVPNSAVSRLRLASGAVVAADVRYGEASGPAQILPGEQALSLALEIGENRGVIDVPPFHFYAGSYYSLIALPGSAFAAPSLLIAETSLWRGVSASMPAPALAAVEEAVEDRDAVVEEPASQAEDQPSPAEESPTVAEEPAAADEELSTAAEEPAAAPEDADDAMESAPDDETQATPEAEEQIAPSLVAVSPYAIVDLDPAARLQLRQYPSVEALSLGLLPGEASVIVLGRRGLTQYSPGEVPDLPLDLSDFAVDPAASLYPAQDLAPADTWLFVMYRTADDGALLGWSNAGYLRVFSATGENQRLASLPPVRQNRAGGAISTDMQPPDLADFVSARVYRLDEGALLNLRMANDPTSEVLTQLPPGAKLSLLGLDAGDTWVYVDYQPEADKVIRGWVSAAYTQLLLNGVPVQASALRALDETVAPRISDDMRGGVRHVQTSEPTAPPPDDAMKGIAGEVALDPGAMLHLRREPNANAESLALLPAGARVPINGITESAEWLLTSYREQEGWIAAQYVALLLRGREYHRAYVESLLPPHDNSGKPAG